MADNVTLDFSTFKPSETPQASSAQVSPVSQPASAQTAPGKQATTLDFSTFAPISSSQGTDESEQKPGILAQAGDTIGQWLLDRYTHPLRTMGSQAKGIGTAVYEISPIAGAVQSVKDLHDNIDFYNAKRKEGMSVYDALDATNKENQRKSAPHVLFRKPDDADSPDAHLLYDSLSASHGEIPARLVVAARRVMESELQDFQKDPDQFMSNVSVKLLPFIIGGAAGAASGEGEISNLGNSTLNRIKSVVPNKGTIQATAQSAVR